MEDWKLGDVITNKMKKGPHFMITELKKQEVVCLQLDGEDEHQYFYFSREDMWVFKKV